MNTLLKNTPWDSAAFGMPTWELVEYSATAMQQAVQTAGHHTIKVDPLADKRLLHEHGFYYCDTLIETHCTEQRLKSFEHELAMISRKVAWDELQPICNGAFAHGRFHRDFNLDKARADLRYDNWLKQLHEQGQVYGLFWDGSLAGFIGYASRNLVLHAVAQRQRGKGLAKYWWSAACKELLASGHEEVRSSISASNVAVINLYASLGFSFDNPKDIYHRLVS